MNITHFAYGDQDLKFLDHQYCNPWGKADPACRELLNQVRMHVWRGATAYLAVQDGETAVSIHVGRGSKQRRGAWGLYYNWLVAYTPPEYRRQGFARGALEYAVHAQLTPQDRLKSLAGSLLGMLLHSGLDHAAWGTTDKGEVVIDSPLAFDTQTRDDVPFHGRTVGEGAHLWTPNDWQHHFLSQYNHVWEPPHE